MHEDLISIFPKLTNKSCVIYNPVSTHIFDYVNQNDLTKIKKKLSIMCRKIRACKGLALCNRKFCEAN